MSTRLSQRVIAKTASYTIKYPMDAPGTRFTNRGAVGSVTFTLPTPGLNLTGVWYEFEGHAAQTFIVAGATSGKIATLGNAAADNVSFAVASNKIGRKIYAKCDGTQWHCYGAGGGGFCVNGVQVSTTSTESNYLSGVTAGTVTASKGVVVDANKAVDVLSATTQRNFGGTGVAAAAGVVTEIVKEVTGIVDAAATAILTVTVPNAAHAARIEIDILGRLGAGGSIGADEGISSSKYIASVTRTAGVASVLVLGAQLGVAQATVAGGQTVTAVLTQVANAEGVGAANTHTIKVTITRSGAGASNHKCEVHAKVHNSNATGVSLA